MNKKNIFFNGSYVDCEDLFFEVGGVKFPLIPIEKIESLIIKTELITRNVINTYENIIKLNDSEMIINKKQQKRLLYELNKEKKTYKNTLTLKQFIKRGR